MLMGSLWPVTIAHDLVVILLVTSASSYWLVSLSTVLIEIQGSLDAQHCADVGFAWPERRSAEG